MRPFTADVRAHKVRSGAYTAGINEVLRYNPQAFEPKRQNMINFTSSDFNIVNFDAIKSPEHLIASSAEKSNQLAVPIKATSTRKSQLAMYRTTTDPGIGFGVEAAGARMT